MFRIIRGALAVSAATLTLVASVAPPSAAHFDAVAQTASPALVDLHDISDLRARFNADSAFTRLVLLVSPT